MTSLLVWFAPAVALADEDEPPRSSWSRLVESGKSVFRGPQKADPRPPAVGPAEATRATYNQAEPKPPAKDKTKPATARRGWPFAGKPTKPSRTVSEYMAQERP
jgi:hypothetical protein